MHPTVTSLQCQCLSWLTIDQGNLRKPKPTKTQQQIKKKPRWNGETRVILRFGMAARIQGKFGGWWNSITGRLSRQFFSWSFFRANNKETWTSCRNFWWLDNSRSQGLKRQLRNLRNNHRYAVVVQDLATQWIESYPCKTKTFQETHRSLQKFLEPERKTKSH